MYPAADALAARGHRVAIISEGFGPETLGPETLAPPGGVEEKLIILKNKDCRIWGLFACKISSDWDSFLWKTRFNAWKMRIAWRFGANICQELLTNQREDFNSIIDQHWDLVFVDSIFSVCGIAHVRLLNQTVPYAVLHASFFEGFASTQRALARSIVTIPPEYPIRNDFFPSRFINRMDSVWNYLQHYFAKVFVVDRQMAAALRPSVGRVSLIDFYRDSSATFVGYPDLLDWPYPLGKDVVSFGGDCNLLTPQPLPPDLEAFVSDPESKGTILIAFGTYVTWETAPKDVLDSLLAIMSELSDYRIVWKNTGPNLGLPKHIRAVSWAPQVDLLLHPKTKLFWTHGGIKSLKEAACAGRAAVVMPIFADQARNAVAAKRAGFGEIVDKFVIRENKKVLKNIRKVLESPSYERAAARLRALLQDHLVTSSKGSAIFAEFLMKHGGLPEILQRKGNRMQWPQYFCLDIVAFFLLCFTALISVA